MVRCWSLRQRVNELGSCIPCGDYEMASEDGKYCVAKVCGANEIVKPDATCVACPNYTTISLDRRSCVNQCGLRQYITITGTCELCPNY